MYSLYLFILDWDSSDLEWGLLEVNKMGLTQR